MCMGTPVPDEQKVREKDAASVCGHRLHYEQTVREKDAASVLGQTEIR